jgi:hypothetical protein
MSRVVSMTLCRSRVPDSRAHREIGVSEVAPSLDRLIRSTTCLKRLQLGLKRTLCPHDGSAFPSRLSTPPGRAIRVQIARANSLHGRTLGNQTYANIIVWAAPDIDYSLYRTHGLHLSLFCRREVWMLWKECSVTRTRRFEAREPNDVGPDASRRSTGRCRVVPAFGPLRQGVPHECAPR